jgi:hypothetical protein
MDEYAKPFDANLGLDAESHIVKRIARPASKLILLILLSGKVNAIRFI